jgi:hypothetical protein
MLKAPKKASGVWRMSGLLRRRSTMPTSTVMAAAAKR